MKEIRYYVYEISELTFLEEPSPDMLACDAQITTSPLVDKIIGDYKLLHGLKPGDQILSVGDEVAAIGYRIQDFIKVGVCSVCSLTAVRREKRYPLVLMGMSRKPTDADGFTTDYGRAVRLPIIDNKQSSYLN